MPISRAFCRLLGSVTPYEFQKCMAEYIYNGKAVVLRAPTGAGKSETAFAPFLAHHINGTAGTEFPNRLIWALPMRALARSLAERFARKLMPDTLSVSLQHGDLEPKSEDGFWSNVLVAAFCAARSSKLVEGDPFFLQDAVFATIDQVVTSYACAPLSLPPRYGNIPAGAVASAYLVFDEVHMLDPVRAFQAMLILADRAAKLRIPFVIMTATLPENALHLLAERFNEAAEDNEFCQVCDFKDNRPIETPNGAEQMKAEQRQVTLKTPLETHLSVEAVLKLIQEHNAKKVLIVANTVDTAIELYTGLQSKHENVMLIHSRFTTEHRRKKEQQLQRWMGKDGSDENCIVIAAQVVEVGLDISADLVVSELAPLDALLQRAGRCARWGGPGTFCVLGSADENKKFVPYKYSKHEIARAQNLAPLFEEFNKTLERTEEELKKHNGQTLDWTREREMIDAVYKEYYEHLLESDAGVEAYALLAEAAFTGSKTTAEKAVRVIDSVEVAVYDLKRHYPRLTGLPRKLWLLPRISVSRRLLLKKMEEASDKGVFLGWILEETAPQEDEETRVKLKAQPIKPRDVKERNWRYDSDLIVLHPAFAGYSPKEGLTFQGEGEELPPPEDKKSHDSKDERRFQRKPESWVEHALATVDAFRTHILPRESYALRVLQCITGWSEETLMQVLKTVLALHDLGKLTEQWQFGIRQTLTDDERETCGEEPLAKGGNAKVSVSLPPHATISAYLLMDALVETYGRRAVEVALAVAHHHSVRALEVPSYELVSGAGNEVEAALRRVDVGTTLLDRLLEKSRQRESTNLGRSMVPFGKAKRFALYAVVARILRACDWLSSGGATDANNGCQDGA